MTRSGDQKLLVINQYYKPDLASTGQLAAEICESLVEHGFDVHVVTGQPSYTAESPDAAAHETLNGVEIHRLDLGRSRGRESMRTRLAGYGRFLAKAWRQARRLAKTEHFDAVLTFHNPPFVGLIGARLAKRFRLDFTYVLYDIHPDVLIATGWMGLPQPAVWLWERLHRWIMERAKRVVVLGEGMRETLEDGKGVDADKVSVIPLWGRPEFEPATRDQPIRHELGIGDHELLLLYSGNIGIMHPLDPILDAASELQDEAVRILFVGDGAKREDLVERVERENLANVTFLPFQSEDRFAQLVAASDACFVTLEPGLERLALPSRTFTFISAGRPLITIMAPEADVARLATEHECGWNVETGTELAQLVRSLLADREALDRYGWRARELYDARFRRNKVIRQYVDLLEDV